jgi:hypothetical protein
MKKLYKFHWECGRMGDVEGLFVADEEEIKKAIGQHVGLGDALGKHSDIHGDLEADDLTVLTDDQDFIKKFEEYNCASGYNPLKYLNE